MKFTKELFVGENLIISWGTKNAILQGGRSITYGAAIEKITYKARV